MSDVLCKDTESTGTSDMLLMFRGLDRSLVTRPPGAVSEGKVLESANHSLVWCRDPERTIMFERL